MFFFSRKSEFFDLMRNYVTQVFPVRGWNKLFFRPALPLWKKNKISEWLLFIWRSCSKIIYLLLLNWEEMAEIMGRGWNSRWIKDGVGIILLYQWIHFVVDAHMWTVISKYSISTAIWLQWEKLFLFVSFCNVPIMRLW